MATTNARRTGVSPFAHLLSMLPGAAKGGKAEDDREGLDAEDEDDDVDAEDDDSDQTDAESDEDTDTDAEDDPEDKPKDAKKAKRAKKAESDDDAEGKAEDENDDEEMAQARRDGFLAAQARGRAIFSAPSAAVRPDMAAHFAFDEDMPSAKAIAMLDMAASGGAGSPEGRGSSLHRRMSRVVLPKPGNGGTGGKSGAKSEVDAFAEMAKNAAEKAGIR